MKNIDIAKKYLPKLDTNFYCPNVFGMNVVDCDDIEDCADCWEMETELDTDKIKEGLKILLAGENAIIERAKKRKNNILDCLDKLNGE